MAEILQFDKDTKTVADVIEEIAKAGVTELVVLGYDQNNKEFFSGTIRDGAEVNWLLDRLKFNMMVDISSDG